MEVVAPSDEDIAMDGQLDVTSDDRVIAVRCHPLLGVQIGEQTSRVAGGSQLLELELSPFGTWNGSVD